MTDDWGTAPILEGKHVRLEPLAVEHADGLFEAGQDPDIWTWLSAKARPADVPGAQAWIEKHRVAHGIMAFAQIDVASGQVCGTTSYHDIDAENRVLGIGHTWLGKQWRRTACNTESKLLLLTHAFDVLGANRVFWQTDDKNLRSQQAIERLGAKPDGVLRNHRIRSDGSLRHSFIYSMIPAEWPAARERLTQRLLHS
ncbi:N-acetyltransferase [Pseudonocardiaceae bacterium YIM PH 21723]|nr:N-acetyltransferase [Pseudonocardiaceae bacterium YIM PH 21723]